MKAEVIQAADGTRLASRVYEPDSPDRGSVVIGGAMGVRQDYYAPFAQWLAGQGWRVTTFDYRGIGRFRAQRQGPARLQGRPVRLDARLRSGHRSRARRAAGAPAVPAGPQPGRTVARPLEQPAQGQRHAQRRGRQRLLARERAAAQAHRFLFLVRARAAGDRAVRLLSRPQAAQGRRLAGRRRDAVAQVVPESRDTAWAPKARQCGSATPTSRFPVHALSITDDELMTLVGTHSLINLYENSPREVERIAPADLGVRRLGHFGPFRSEHEAKLWPRMARWLQRAVAPRQPHEPARLRCSRSRCRRRATAAGRATPARPTPT